MTLETHKKHPADALVIQRFTNGPCRVSVSQSSAYFSVTKKFGYRTTKFTSVNLAFQGMVELREKHDALKDMPIWLLCNKNEWVQVDCEDELLMYLLSIS